MKFIKNNLLGSILRTIGKVIVWLVIGVIIAVLMGKKDLMTVYALNTDFVREENDSILSLNVNTCRNHDCSNNVFINTKQFRFVEDSGGIVKENIFWQTSDTWSPSTSYGFNVQVRSNYEFVKGYVYTVSIIVGNDLTPMHSYGYVSTGAGASSNNSATLLSYREGGLSSCSFDNNTFNYCTILYYTFVPNESGMYLSLRSVPDNSVIFENGKQVMINSHISIMSLGPYSNVSNTTIQQNIQQQTTTINNIKNQLNETQTDINEVQQQVQETNNKLADVDNSINSDSEDTESTSCGIICKLKGIWNGIINLPNLLLDGIKGLFVPTDDQLLEIVNDSKELTENFGFVGESTSFFLNIFTSLLGLANANGCIVLPEFTIGSTTLFDSFTFWEEQQVCLADNVFLSTHIDTIRTVTSIASVCLFLVFANAQFFNVLNKKGEDVTVITDNKRGGNV